MLLSDTGAFDVSLILTCASAGGKPCWLAAAQAHPPREWTQEEVDAVPLCPSCAAAVSNAAKGA